MKLLLLEPYYGGSHRVWADGYQQHSRHDVSLITLPAQYWKWRMQGGAISLANMINSKPDVILASDMMDLSIFRSLTYKQLGDVPTAFYFHENQLTYPQNERQAHGYRYGFINYVSALTADVNYFNSEYHRDVFLDELPRLLKHFADYNELQTLDTIRQKSFVLPPGMDLIRYDSFKPLAKIPNEKPLILWNHRWEEDKNPQLFLSALYQLADAGYDFEVAITGENFYHGSADFANAKTRLGKHIIQMGYIESEADYAKLLWQADYIVSTAYQDFFGISVAEAIYCECIPILPYRLNYPYLIPPEYHSACLYQDDNLVDLLKAHLENRIQVDRMSIKAKIAHYDWTILVQQYDDNLEALVP